jgi:uncharacterized protein YbjT (DUF2867 family)
MQVAIAGAHGKIGRLLTRLLVERGDTVVGLIRNPDQADDISADGATPVLCDLEHATEAEIAEAIAGANAAVFTAGAGAGSGPERKLTLDRDGAIKLLNAARAAGVPRYAIVSSVGTENPPHDDDTFSVYLRAKAEADTVVKASDREWTVLRPGRLTDDPATGQARLDADPFRGSVARADVAAVIAAVLLEPRSVGATLYLGGGNTPIADALDRALGD